MKLTKTKILCMSDDDEQPLMDTRKYINTRRGNPTSDYSERVPRVDSGEHLPNEAHYNCQRMRGGEGAWLKCRSGLIWPVTLEYQDSWHSSFQLVG